MKTVLALGADIKNRFLIAKGDTLRFGDDIADLGIAENFEKFKRSVNKAAKKIKPSIIACDLHPGYFSTRFAAQYARRNTQCEIKYVQHHHAHVASVMYEHSLKGPVIGVSFDGTGFGADGNIWGGEFLLVDNRGFKRLAHLKYRKMPGGDKVVKEPWRMALSILGKKAASLLPSVKKKDKELILAIMAKDINSPLTSSAGRIFDAAAALLGVCERASYEAEGPIKLEVMCENGLRESYEFASFKRDNLYIIDVEPIFLEMAKEIKRRKNMTILATKFHNSVSNIIVETAKKLSKITKVKNIALSGGVFQNGFLKKNTMEKLTGLGFCVFTNEKTPVNDFNIALGQYYVLSTSRKN